MMLSDPKDGEIIDILCLRCKNKQSIIRVDRDGSERGECTQCGNITYQKMSYSEKAKAEKESEEQINSDSANMYRNEVQRIRDDLTSKPTNKYGITCPYCHSTNVEKITMGKRVVKGWLWGAAAANTLVKEWHCKNCKSNF